jgi:hypothetical protein
VKRQPTEWEKILAGYGRGLIARIYKKFKKVNTKKENNSINTWANELNLFFGGIGVLTQDFTLAKQVLYYLSHSISPFLVLGFSR